MRAGDDRPATVRDTATVSVSAPVDGTRRRKRRTQAASSMNSRLTRITVDPQVWAAALDLAGGDAARIEVHSSTNVTIHNKPWRITKNRKDGA